MSLDIGELVGYIKLDHSGVGQGIRAAQADIRSGMAGVVSAAERGGEQAGKGAGSKLSGAFKGQVGELGKVVAGAFAVEKVVDFVRGSIDAASDLNETINMSSAVFGKNEAVIEQWASGAARNLGLSKQAAIDNAASFGDMFLQLGFAGDQATNMSKSVVQMAADLGSFKNLKTEDVVERLSAAFRGEYDSLQALIPNISAARVEQEAMAETGKTSATALTAQEKAAATLAIVQKDGARAMGDFGKTADSAANATKIAAAETEDLKAQIGQYLLPAYIALVHFGRDQVIPFLSDTVTAIGAFGTAAAPAAAVVRDLTAGFTSLPGPLQTSIVGLTVLLALGPRLATFATTLRTQVVTGAGAASRSLDGLRLSMMYANESAKSGGGGFKAYAGAIGTTAGQGLRGAASGLLGVLGGPWGVAFLAATTAVGFYVQKQQEAKQRVQELTDTLDKQTGAITEQTRQTVVNQLEQQGFLQTYQQAGVSLKVATDAALGNADALSQVNDKLRELSSQRDALAVAKGDTGAITTQINALDALVSTSGEVADATESARRKTEAMGTAAQGTAAATSDLAPKVASVGTAAKDAADEVESLSDAFDRATGRVADARGATRDYQAAFDGAAESLKQQHDDLVQTAEDHGKGKAAAEAYAQAQISSGAALDVGTDAGRRNQAALDQIASSAIASTKANIAQGQSIADTTAQLNAARGAFIDNAVRMGLSRDKAAALATQLGLTANSTSALRQEVQNLPANKDIKVTASVDAAAQRVAYIRDLVASLHDKTINVVTQTQTKNILGNTLSAGLSAGTRAYGGISVGHVRKMADGGFTDRQAMFADRAITWAEAGAEAYIPLSPGPKRARALDLWRKTGELIGAEQGAGRQVVNHNTFNLTTRDPYVTAHEVARLSYSSEA